MKGFSIYLCNLREIAQETMGPLSSRSKLVYLVVLWLLFCKPGHAFGHTPGLPSTTPPPPVAFFMQHLEICLPTALLTTEAYFSFQLSLTHSLLLFLKNVNNIYVSASQYRIE